MSHVFTFLGGTAVGALVAYMTKDEATRKAVERFVDGLADALKAFLGRMTPEKGAEAMEAHSDTLRTMVVEEEEETPKQAVEKAVEPVQEVTKAKEPLPEKKAAA